jgi:hypothetical protein
VIEIGTLLVRLVLAIIIPAEFLSVYRQTMVLDLIVLFIYIELLNYFLRNGKAIWFLKKSVK